MSIGLIKWPFVHLWKRGVLGSLPMQWLRSWTSVEVVDFASGHLQARFSFPFPNPNSPSPQFLHFPFSFFSSFVLFFSAVLPCPCYQDICHSHFSAATIYCSRYMTIPPAYILPLSISLYPFTDTPGFHVSSSQFMGCYCLCIINLVCTQYIYTRYRGTQRTPSHSQEARN